ncbi:MAG: hypothetical protein VX593_07500, partial [Pseudomonadota bacterium]|nr:hypothetical protein [Pseudomonadota bacterium]
TVMVSACGDPAGSLKGQAERYYFACTNNLVGTLDAFEVSKSDPQYQPAVKSFQKQCRCDAKGLGDVLTDDQLGILIDAHNEGHGGFGTIAALDKLPANAKLEAERVLNSCVK